MIQSALFTYRVAVQNKEGETIYNDNFINPLAVISAFWQTNPDGKKVLAVFLPNQKTINFGETVGKRFLDHLEDFLRYFIALPQSRFTKTTGPHFRRPVEAVIVEEEVPQTESAEWQK